MKHSLAFLLFAWACSMHEAECWTWANCGRSVDNRIVSGSEASPFSIPWQVYLPYPGCGGTLISPIHVLTAAHCVRYLPNGPPTMVVVGEHDTTNHRDGVPHEIACIKSHPQYNKRNFRFDHAVITLKKPVDIISSNHARLACLPINEKQYGSGEQMTVSGWGLLQGLTQLYASKLHHLKVKGVSNEVCQNELRQITNPNTRITPEMMCTEGSGNVSSCNGDSGGPLTVQENGFTHVVGIVSWGTITCRGDSVYARVSSVKNWIIQNGVYPYPRLYAGRMWTAWRNTC